MEASFTLDSVEIKEAIIKEIKEKMGVNIVPADANLYVKFDTVTKNVTDATLTVKKE
jgi:hypothetical protein